VKGVLNLAAYYYESGEVEKALALYKQALIINPDVRLYLAIGHIYHNVGYFKHEIDSYMAAVDMDTTNVDALFYLATAYYEQDMLISAKTVSEKALKIAPNNKAIVDLTEKIAESMNQ
jgi:tetratricopeptide (TPR) repeat protein